MYGNDASNNLSWTKMNRLRDQIHIREKVTDEQNRVSYKKMSVWKTRIGSHDCASRRNRNSDLAEYGVGTVFYFQMLKYLAAMFFMMFVLSMPGMIFFYSGSEVEDASLTKLVAAGSLGNLGASEPVCREGEYDLSTPELAANPKGIVQLNCAFGELYSLYDFGQLSKNTKTDCSEIKK